MIDYNGRIFRPVLNSPNGEVNQGTRFVYSQAGQVLTATYSGGGIRLGQMVGRVDAEGNLDFLYQHMSDDGSLHAGRCQSRPEILTDGRVRLREAWQWFSDDQSQGASIVEEESPT